MFASAPQRIANLACQEALVGAIGATSAPVAGYLADAGQTVRATLIALVRYLTIGRPFSARSA